MKRNVYILFAFMLCLLEACSGSSILDLDNMPESVTKAGRLETVEITLETAGTLAEKLGDKIGTVQKLVLAGPVDAGDINTIRNNMPKLVSLDIKGVELMESDKKFTSPWGQHSVKKETIVERMFARLNLTQLVLPENINTIEHWAFAELPIETITLPSAITKIESYAFEECKKMTSIAIPDNVFVVDKSTFNRCDALQNVSLPSNLEKIGSSAFSDCISLQEIDIPTTVTEIESGAFGHTGLKSIVIPDKIKTISSSCFSRCEALETVSLPLGLSVIESYAFQGCASLKELKIPESVIQIGSSAFKMTNLETIVLPESITTISQSCFSSCKNLKKIQIPSGVTKIEHLAFYDCSFLTTVEFSKNLQEIGTFAFQLCTSLADIDLPDGLLYIKKCAFESCSALKTVDIPKSVQSIEQGAFTLTNLGAIFLEGKTKLDDLFLDSYNRPSNCLIYLSDPDTDVSPKLRNIIYNGVASALVLDGEGPNFYCPQEFKAQKITFTKSFNNQSGRPILGQAAGWIALSLPFSVDKIVAEDGRLLAPFRAEVANAKPFWLRKLTANGFENTTRIEAGMPYIIAMPFGYKAEEYNISGKVAFTAQDLTNGITIPVTAYNTVPGPEFDFHSSFETQPKSASVYVLNSYENVQNYNMGGVFVKSLRDTKPFEAYVTSKVISARSPAMFSIGGGAYTRASRIIGNKPDIDDM